VFERYTERARRSIFFARYEASLFGSQEIRSEELLLGLLREDRDFAKRIGSEAMESIRKEIDALAPPGDRIPTSVDLPLSMECRQALMFAAEEAERLGHEKIDSVHLMLGLLRDETGHAAELLRKYGIDYDACLAMAGSLIRKESAPVPLEDPALSLELQARSLRHLVDQFLNRVPYSAGEGGKVLRRKPWTRAEALGHSIDWGMVHHQWLLQALVASKIAAAEYPSDSTASLRRYAGFSWTDLVDLWVSLNRLLAHVLEKMPQDRANAPCRIGVASAVPLTGLMDAYIQHCEDIVGQILTLS
jgi:hypothetical protein